MDEKTRNDALNTLGHLGITARPKVGRPPRGKAPGEEIWVIGAGPNAPQVLATPLRTGMPTRKGDNALGLPRLWVAEFIAIPTARRLIAEGDGFVDAAGNAHLQLPGIVIHVLGKRQPRETKAFEEPTRRTWRGPALRALFQLLCNPKLAERPVREIAAAAATAPGTIVHLLEDLEHTGNLVRLGPRKRRFLPDQDLADTWMAEYERKLRPKLFLGRFTGNAPDWWRTFKPEKHDALWGGEVAATLLGADLRPGVITLYTKTPHTAVLRAAKLRPDTNGTVEMRKQFWTAVAGAPRKDITHPILVTADLLATRDGRCAAAAQYIRREYSVGLASRD